MAAGVLARGNGVGLDLLLRTGRRAGLGLDHAGCVVGTLLLGDHLGLFKFYLANFTDYNATYGAVGGVIVLLLWFYISGLVIFVGAELNAEIEHASPHGKNPGEKVPGRRRRLARLLLARTRSGWPHKGNRRRHLSGPSPSRPFKPNLHVPDRKLGIAVGLSLLATRFLWKRLRRGRAGRIETNDEVTPWAPTKTNARWERCSRSCHARPEPWSSKSFRLARTELTEKAAKMGKGAAFVLAGGLIAYGGLLAIVAALVLILIAIGLPPWAAAALGGVFAAGIGYLLIRSGLAALKPQDLAPRQTIETLKEDAQWLKAQAK